MRSIAAPLPSGHFQVAIERLCRKNQHIRPLSEGPEWFARAKHIGPFALVIGATAHHRLARAEGAADRRYRVPRVGWVA
jgi:hypothetical protein